ncbi:hypothetical protein [Jutongia sp. SJQ-6]|jgi:hypothetical protein
MVNEKKVRLMTQLALDEKRLYKDELDESGYFRSDYIRSNTLKVLLGYSISYLLIMGLVAMYYVDYLFTNVVQMDMQSMVWLAGCIYVGLLLIITLFCVLFYMTKYTNNRKRLRKYMMEIDKLQKFYRDSKDNKETKEIKEGDAV